MHSGHGRHDTRSKTTQRRKKNLKDAPFKSKESEPIEVDPVFIPYSSTNIYDHIQHNVTEEYIEKSFDLRKDVRLDKREHFTEHTVIISGRGTAYELMGTLDQYESKELQKQTGLYKRHKVVLGQGRFGKVRLVRDPSGKFLAVKKVANPDTFANEYQFQKMLEEKNIPHVLQAKDELIVKNAKGKLTIYQIMPIENLGSGVDLMADFPMFSQEERNQILIFLAYHLADTFSSFETESIFHLDFKPSNFLLSLYDGKAKVDVADFGGAKWLDESGKVKLQVGNLTDANYYSPEMFCRGHGLTNSQDFYRLQDAWRLGLTLLELVDATLADKYKSMWGKLSSEMNYRKKVKEFDKLHKELKKVLQHQNLPKGLRDVIEGLLQPDWKERKTVHDAMKKTERLGLTSHKEVAVLFHRLLTARVQKAMQVQRHLEYGEKKTKNDRPAVEKQPPDAHKEKNRKKTFISGLQKGLGVFHPTKSTMNHTNTSRSTLKHKNPKVK